MNWQQSLRKEQTMTKKTKDYDPLHPLEIIISTYWPTNIVKEVQITNPSKDKWHNEITLSKAEAHYLFNQLAPIFQQNTVINTPEIGLRKD